MKNEKRKLKNSAAPFNSTRMTRMRRIFTDYYCSKVPGFQGFKSPRPPVLPSSRLLVSLSPGLPVSFGLWFDAPHCIKRYGFDIVLKTEVFRGYPDRITWMVFHDELLQAF